MILFIILVSYNRANGEVIFLKDGQILKGAIVDEDRETVTLDIQYQKRKIVRSQIMRILYGDTDLERIYILLKQGALIKGFLVDQDSEKIIYRDFKGSNEEKTIDKNMIRQISREEIIQLNPYLTGSMGVFIPAGSGGAKLGRAPVYFTGSGMNLTAMKNIRLLFEAGYTKSRSENSSSRFIEFVPLTVNVVYTIPFTYADVLLKAGTGAAFIKFNNGEGDKYQSFNPDFSGGLGLQKELFQNTLHAVLWIENNLVLEGTVFMNNIIIRTGFSLMF